ncbi:pentapeptide repeat-containing protein [Nocardia sienata]|uniref:pentapeptide repeat-containing protein n=1 Tax=Nocardia sienata TaxID=248552 RepID=UPI000A04D9F3
MANLSGADLSGASLFGADLSRADLTGATLLDLRDLEEVTCSEAKPPSGADTAKTSSNFRSCSVAAATASTPPREHHPGPPSRSPHTSLTCPATAPYRRDGSGVVVYPSRIRRAGHRGHPQVQGGRPRRGTPGMRRHRRAPFTPV